MSGVARKVCMSVGKDAVGSADGVTQILRKLRERFAPDAIDSVFQGVVRFMCFKRADRKMETSLMEFDMLRQRAEARMLMGSDFPDEFVSVLCMQNSAVEKCEDLGACKTSEYIGLPGCIGSGASCVWSLRLWPPPRCSCGGGYAYGVRGGGF